jgi:acyl-CoA oxidase
MAWYLLNGRLSAARGHAVTAYVDRLIARLRPHAQELVDAFGYGPEHLRAEIATGVEQARQDEARAYFGQLRDAGLEPMPEKKP